MTQIEKTIALLVKTASFTNHHEIWGVIDEVRKHINAAEGIDDDSRLLEIRIPFNFPVPSFFDGLGNAPLISKHQYQFVACLGSFNWCIIFNDEKDAEQYMNNPDVEPFMIGQDDLSKVVIGVPSGQQAIDERPDKSTIGFYWASDGLPIGCRCLTNSGNLRIDNPDCFVHHPRVFDPQKDIPANMVGYCDRCKEVQSVTSGATCLKCGDSMWFASMQFGRLARVNLERYNRWHPKGIDSWDLNKWMVAMTGELGEAANKIKKLNRLSDGLVGNKDTVSDDFSELLVDIVLEIADTVIYADLMIQIVNTVLKKHNCSYDVTLEWAIKQKFNEVSDRNGFPEKL